MPDEQSYKETRPRIEPAHLRTLLSYDPESGKLYWLKRPITSRPDSFNARFAGAEAFTHKNNQGYCHSKIFGKTYKAHRVAWALHYGVWPEGQIDHINHDRADNRIANLRCVPQADNARNKRIRHDNLSGHTGVRQSRWGSKWEANISHNARQVHLGTFPTRDAAISARKAAEKRFGYHPNHGGESA